MGGERGKRVVVGKGAVRDVVGALPGRAGVGIIADILIVKRRAHVEGIERRVVVVAEPAPCEELAADVQLLLGKDVQSRQRGVVVEGIPVEHLAVVTDNEYLQVLALLQGASANLLAGAWQDECLQVVALQERVGRQHVLLVDPIRKCRYIPGNIVVRDLEVGVVQVDVFQVAQVVAAVVPGAVACEVAQQAEVGTGDGPDDLQATDAAVVATDTDDGTVVL